MFSSLNLFGEEEDAMRIDVIVKDKVLNKVDSRLFGQFMERPGSEAGPENIFVPGTQTMQPKAIEMLKAMKIPIIRFPAGTTIDYLNWQDAISNVPGRGKERPLSKDHMGKDMTNKFGYDEYFKVRDELKCQTILVVNLLDGLAKRRSLEDAALNAAGLVAYANAPLGTKLPEGMPDWPSVRKANGHPEPYKAEYIQIGNEWFLARFHEEVKEKTGIKDLPGLSKWYIKCITKYIEMIDAVDPSVKIIIDGNMGMGSAFTNAVISDPFIKRNADFITFHTYAPGKMDDIKLDGAPYDKITAEELWYNWVSMPGVFSDMGENVGLGDEINNARNSGYRISCTEWNWNGWGLNKIVPPPEITHHMAACLGAAGFMHGLMRQGNDIDIATQSMLIGSGWGIASIRIDPEAKIDPFFNPQGHAEMFYANHHGDRLLEISITGNQAYEQPYQNHWSPPKRKVAYADVLASATDGKIFVHVINRYFKKKIVVDIDAGAVGGMKEDAVQFCLEGSMKYDPKTYVGLCRISEKPVAVKDGKLSVETAPGSLSIVEIGRKNSYK